MKKNGLNSFTIITRKVGSSIRQKELCYIYLHIVSVCNIWHTLIATLYELFTKKSFNKFNCVAPTYQPL